VSSPINSSASTGVGDGAARTFETLGVLVASLAARGERVAVVAYTRDGAVSLSYSRLAELIRRTAHGLRRSGIGRGDRVAVLGPNSPEWIVAYFGIVAAGAAAVPLDPQATAESTVAALSHAEARTVITTRAQRDTLAPLVGSGIRFWLFDASGDEGVTALAGIDDGSKLPAIGDRDLASLLFTSGTTGTPKAVSLTHGNLAANLTALRAVNLIDAHDRVLLPLPLHHTYPFTVGLLTALATGATLVLPAGISGPEILEACRSSQPTALLAVPRLCAAVWDAVQSAVAARGALAARVFAALLAASIALRRHTKLRAGRWLFRSVRTRLGGALELIGCGGAKLPEELAWKLEGLGFRVLTGYGLTETSPVLTFNSPTHSHLGSEGRPLPGVEVRIAETGAAPGEILARGPGVFAGYWHDPAATAATFTADGWFKTGDLGRIDSDGYLHVVGRSKELVVLADGKKFFPEVVEKHYADSLLLRELGVFEHAGVLAAVIVPDEDEVRRRGSLREAAAVREELESIGSRLPPYQRITSYRVVRSPLPRTQLGKLRRHLLPALFDGAINVRSNEAATITAEDRALLDTPLGGNVWRWLRERFAASQLTLDTSPQLDLNIDSLGWVALTVEIEQRFRVALRADRLARVLTLRDLLREVEAAQGDAGTPQSAAAPFAPPGPWLRAFGALLLALARLLARVALQPVVTGLEHLPPGATLIAPNHSSYLDPLAIAAALPWRRLRRTYWAGWAGVMHTSAWRRIVSRAVHVFPVDPDRDLAAAVRTARELLARGHDVVWFPEGRRSPTGELQEFQNGVGVLAEGIAAAIVPAAIDGTFAAWPKHRRWPRAARVRVAFGEPLHTARDAKPADVRTSLQSAVQRLLADFGAATPIDQPNSRPPRRT
jgi:long-chain acyl-CoA synthetase